MPKLVNRLICIALGLLAFACSGSERSQFAVLQDQLDPAASEIANAVSTYVLPGCLADDPQGISLTATWREDANGQIATVEAANLKDAKAVYFSLPLPESVSGRIEIIEKGWAGEDALSIAVPASPHELHVGIAMVHPQDRQGFYGETQLATIAFGTAASTSYPARSVAKAPTSPRSQIDLDYDPLGNMFYWYYRNEGDYNQNGEVGVSDLTPIAVHFGKKTSGSFPEESIESVVDGDGNGEINVADIAPIGVGFGSRVDSFNIYRNTADKYPANPTDPSVIPESQTVAFNETDTLSGEGRLYYSVQNQEAPDPVPAYWLRPVDDGSEGIPSLIAGNGNQPPVVSLTASQTLGVAPLDVTLDASATTDPEGGPLIFKWVIYNLAYDPSEEDIVIGEPIQQLELESGTYAAAVLVQDEDGAYGYAFLLLVVTDTLGWNTWDVDVQLQEMSGYLVIKVLDVDLAEVDGNPWLAFLYQSDLGGGRSGVVLGEDLSAEGLQTKISLDGDGDIVAGAVEIQPAWDGAHVFTLMNRLATGHISHYWVRPQEGTQRHVLAGPLYQVRDMSVALVDGRPAISYQNETNGNLEFILASDDLGAVWPNPDVLDIGDTGQQTNLAVVNGAPVIAYYSPGGLRIRYIDSVLNAGQPQWNMPTTITSLPGAVLRNGLQVLPGGEQWLLVHNTAAMDLGSLSDPNFTTYTSVATTSGNSADLISTAIINDRVCIAWYDKTSTTLRFLRSTDEQATAWEPPVEVASGILVGALSLAEVAGHTAMAWFDGLQQIVHYSLLVE